MHRDIKPANVMFADDGLVKIVDFGVAQSASRGSITETGITVGTLAYMAPEQLLKERDVTAASDVWSLGIVLYEMTTGQRPYAGKDIGPLLRSILHDPVPPVGIPGAAGTRLVRILKQALDKDPLERQTAAELAEQLATLRSEISSTSKVRCPRGSRHDGRWLVAGRGRGRRRDRASAHGWCSDSGRASSTARRLARDRAPDRSRTTTSPPSHWRNAPRPSSATIRRWRASGRCCQCPAPS